SSRRVNRERRLVHTNKHEGPQQKLQSFSQNVQSQTAGLPLESLFDKEPHINPNLREFHVSESCSPTSSPEIRKRKMKGNPMREIVLILSFAVFALTVRGQSVVFDNLEPYSSCYNGQYDIGTFVNASEAAAPFVAQTSGNLTTVDVSIGMACDFFSDCDRGPGTGACYPGPVDVILAANTGSQEFPYPSSSNRILLGSVTPVVKYPDASVVSISVTDTVPVTAGTIYFLVMKA